MKRTIYKYTLQADDRQRITMPLNAKILSVQMQHGEPQLWALVEETEGVEIKTIGVFGTGNPIITEDSERLEFIDTFQLYGGTLVFHCFEIL